MPNLIFYSRNSGGPKWNIATGGTTTEISNYNSTGETWRVHQFTSPGTLTVIRAEFPFRALVVGGGNGGQAMDGNCGGVGNGGAGGGWVATDSLVLSATSYSATIGAGGGGATCSPGGGGTSTFASLSASGGAGAGGGAGYVEPHNFIVGGNGGTGLSSNITGSTDYYGSGGGGGGGIGAPLSSDGPGTYGRGGHGGHWSDNPTRGSSGVSGIVIIAYRIL